MPGPIPYAPIQYTEEQTMLFPGQALIGQRELWDIRSRLPINWASATNKGAIGFWMGAAIAIDASGSGFILADSSALVTQAVGLATLGAPAGDPEIVQLAGLFSLDDWTPVTGTVTLAPRGIYYLGTNGMLVTGPPNLVQVVGIAISSRTMDLVAACSIAASRTTVTQTGIILDGGTSTTNYGATVVVDGGAPATVNTYKFNGGTA